jgi:hypothetical protein
METLLVKYHDVILEVETAPITVLTGPTAREVAYLLHTARLEECGWGWHEFVSRLNLGLVALPTSLSYHTGTSSVIWDGQSVVRDSGCPSGRVFPLFVPYCTPGNGAHPYTQSLDTWLSYAQSRERGSGDNVPNPSRYGRLWFMEQGRNLRTLAQTNFTPDAPTLAVLFGSEVYQRQDVIVEFPEAGLSMWEIVRLMGFYAMLVNKFGWTFVIVTESPTVLQALNLMALRRMVAQKADWVESLPQSVKAAFDHTQENSEVVDALTGWFCAHSTESLLTADGLLNLPTNELDTMVSELLLVLR